MAISDIPEYVEVQPGDLISAGSWNQVQQLGRNSLRLHHHTRPIGTPPNDSDNTDIASQIAGNEISNGAITAAHLSAGCVTAASIANGAVTTNAIAPLGIGSGAIANNAITSPKLAFQTIQSGSLPLGPGGTSEALVQAGVKMAMTIYFPAVVLTSTTGGAGGLATVMAQIEYRQSVGGAVMDVFLRLTNTGTATANIQWEVLTFAQ